MITRDQRWMTWDEMISKWEQQKSNLLFGLIISHENLSSLKGPSVKVI